jgi:Phosphotransferase enzyme family
MGRNKINTSFIIKNSFSEKLFYQQFGKNNINFLVKTYINRDILLIEKEENSVDLSKLKKNNEFILYKILQILFTFYKTRWRSKEPINWKDKPDIWKLINEPPTTNELPLLWFEIRDLIRENVNLKNALGELMVYWNPKHICNADIKLENFMYDTEAEQIYWIDWDRFCLSDELWDVSGLLRMLLFIKFRKIQDFDAIWANRHFQKQVIMTWQRIKEVMPKAKPRKLLLCWVAANLEKTLELVQAEAIDKEVAEFLIGFTELMLLKPEPIYKLLK